jgi:hypothetical protein
MAIKKTASSSVPLDEKTEKTIELLRKVRESTTLQLKPARFMLTTFKSLDGSE